MMNQYQNQDIEQGIYLETLALSARNPIIKLVPLSREVNVHQEIAVEEEILDKLLPKIQRQLEKTVKRVTFADAFGDYYNKLHPIKFMLVQLDKNEHELFQKNVSGDCISIGSQPYCYYFVNVPQNNDTLEWWQDNLHITKTIPIPEEVALQKEKPNFVQKRIEELQNEKIELIMERSALKEAIEYWTRLLNERQMQIYRMKGNL